MKKIYSRAFIILQFILINAFISKYFKQMIAVSNPHRNHGPHKSKR